MPVSRDASGRLPGPGLETDAATRQVLPIVIEIADHFEKMANDDGLSGRIGTKVPGIGIGQSLIDAAKVEPSEPFTREGEEPACAVECLPDTRRRQLGTEAGKIDVEAHIKIGTHRRLHIGVFEHVEMHGDMAAPGVLAEDGGTEVPARVADTRQRFAGLARLERRGRQHGPIIERGCASMGGRHHARASGGR